MNRTSPDLVPEVDRLVHAWLDEAAGMPADPAARRLADVLRDPDGLEFTVGFVDRVVRPEDNRVAAASLHELAQDLPAFLPWHLRTALKAGGRLAPVAPDVVVPVARRALREMVGHLLIDASDARLGKAIKKVRDREVDLNVNLLGEAVLGTAEADRRLEGTRRLLQRPDIDYVSIKVSATVPPHSPWAFEESVDEIEERLLPLFRLAASEGGKFINLDMEEYHDLDLTLAVFMRLLDRTELRDLEAGVVLQAYLPDALGAMIRLQDWAAARRAHGGAPIKVRLVKGANLPMERVDAIVHGWPLATWGSKQQTDTNYLRLLHHAFEPERVQNVRIGVAGHNLFDIAYAWALAGERGVRDRVDFEMLLGMAEAQARAVSRTVGRLRLYVPVVHPDNFDTAVSYLVRRLEEGSSPENFMSSVFELHDDSGAFERERGRFLASLADLDDRVPEPNRRQNRRTDDPEQAARPIGVFDNVADTDPSIEANRRWGKEILARVRDSRVGCDLVRLHTVEDADVLDGVVASAVSAGSAWGARSGADRAAVLRRAAVSLQTHRAELIEAMAAECGKTIGQADPEVSEAIDFANWYADRAEELDRIDGAEHVPVHLTVVTPPWNFPVAIPAGSTLSSLAAGSAVVIKPATQARRCGSLMVQALWEAGVPRDVLQLVHLEENDLGRRLVSDPRVDRLVLTGAYETAEMFRSFRPDLQLLAETSGKNALVVTPHADLDLAVKDLVDSAFGHAGQKCSAASLAILVGSVANSRRFRDQLVDAVTSLRVAYPSDPRAQVGPVIEPAQGKLLRGLTELGPGESWLVEPRRLDNSGRLWSPGVRTGVAPGSEYHLTEYFGPVLGLMEAEDLDEAIALQNQVEYGLTAGLHSLDSGEIRHWFEYVEAGNAYVNRVITGAIVRRQPFGGWKKSSVGAGTKAGGPNYLIGLSDWAPATSTEHGQPGSDPRRILDGASRFLSAEDLAWLDRAAGSDAAAWAEEYGVARDVSALGVERNVLRYRPVPVTIRGEGAELRDVLRVIAAGLCARAPVHLSTDESLPQRIADLVTDCGATYAVEDETAWKQRLTTDPPHRVRLIGGTRLGFANLSGGRPDIALYAQPVVEAGRIELLTFLREQAISATAHRFGSPTHLLDRML